MYNKETKHAITQHCCFIYKYFTRFKKCILSLYCNYNGKLNIYNIRRKTAKINDNFKGYKENNYCKRGEIFL